MAAPPFDWLDSMMWSIAASGVLLGIAAIRLRYNASTDSIEEENKNVSTGLGVALGLSGFYLFIAGIMISFMSPTAFGGRYSILFGGAGALGGLVVISVALALLLRRGLQAASYFGLVTGIYLVVDAMAIWNNGMTRDPTVSTILYLAPALSLFLSVPATHVNNKIARYVFAVFAFLLAIGWIYFAYNTTSGHLAP